MKMASFRCVSTKIPSTFPISSGRKLVVSKLASTNAKWSKVTKIRRETRGSFHVRCIVKLATSCNNSCKVGGKSEPRARNYEYGEE